MKKQINNFYLSRTITQSRNEYYFCVEFLDGGKWKYIFQSYFWKHGAVNECYGSIDISFQMRGGGGLKSPLLLQFPYFELCDNDNKQSNYRLMNG